MESETSGQGSGLSVAGIAILALAFVITFLLKQCIFGAILAIISAILATAGYIESKRTGGPGKISIAILLIALAGMIVHIAWIASGPAMDKSGKETEILIDTMEREKGDDEDKGKILEELEEKAEELEGGGG